MSENKYGSVDEVLEAVNSFVNSRKSNPGYFTGFKIHVFLGRGCHEFELDDSETKTQKEIAHLEKRLKDQKEKLANLKQKKRRVDESE